MPVWILCGLAIASDWVYRPYYPASPAVPDVSLVFVLWLAQRESFGRIVLSIAMVAATRSLLGISGLTLVTAPLVAPAVFLFVMRRWLNLQPFALRWSWCLAGIAVFAWLDAVLRGVVTMSLAAVIVQTALWGALIAAIAMPIFEVLRPVSARHRDWV